MVATSWGSAAGAGHGSELENQIVGVGGGVDWGSGVSAKSKLLQQPVAVSAVTTTPRSTLSLIFLSELA